MAEKKQFKGHTLILVATLFNQIFNPQKTLTKEFLNYFGVNCCSTLVAVFYLCRY